MFLSHIDVSLSLTLSPPPLSKISRNIPLDEDLKIK